jgi:hypothetical protein
MPAYSYFGHAIRMEINSDEVSYSKERAVSPYYWHTEQEGGLKKLLISARAASITRIFWIKTILSERINP